MQSSRRRGLLTRVRLRTKRSSTSWRTWSWFLSRNLCTCKGATRGQLGLEPTQPGGQGRGITCPSVHQPVCSLPTSLPPYSGSGAPSPWGTLALPLQASISLSVLGGTGPFSLLWSPPLLPPLPFPSSGEGGT